MPQSCAVLQKLCDAAKLLGTAGAAAHAFKALISTDFLSRQNRTAPHLGRAGRRSNTFANQILKKGKST